MTTFTLPQRSGLYRFVGKRFGCTRTSFTQVDDIVRVEEQRGQMQWIVTFFGKGGLYPVARFEGIWYRIELEEG